MARQPKNPFHPGEMLLEEFLVPIGLSQAEFARQIGWPFELVLVRMGLPHTSNIFL